MQWRSVGVAFILFAFVFSLLAQPTQQARISFGLIPPSGGGPDSRGNIEGRIVGIDAPANYKIVLYAHTDAWYVQPLADTPYTDINGDGKWSNWTHLGERYGALLVRSSFKPPARVQSLPAVGGEVIAKAEVAAKN